jgi:GNAT superfamily N-acetyltransferase
MIVRPATSADAHAIATFLSELNWFSGLKAKSIAEIETLVSTSLGRDNSQALIEIALIDDKVVGYVHIVLQNTLFLPGPSAYLSELFIHPEFRGQGIGTALLNKALTFAKENRAARVMLNNDRERDSYERGFYAKHGFAERENMANFVLKFSYED